MQATLQCREEGQAQRQEQRQAQPQEQPQAQPQEIMYLFFFLRFSCLFVMASWYRVTLSLLEYFRTLFGGMYLSFEFFVLPIIFENFILAPTILWSDLYAVFPVSIPAAVTY